MKNNSTKKQPKKAIHKKKLWIIMAIGIVTIAAGVVIGVIIATNNKPDDEPSDEPGYIQVYNHGIEELVLKPIIYLYPEKETDLTVRLGAPEKITSSYPKYNDGWNVAAYPDGTLIDKTTGNKLYSLYWEGEKDTSSLDKTVGFVVKGEDSIEFLEEKLEILGLNYKEKEEFIVYWLPKLESHTYNYIYFATEDEIEEEMPLKLSVKPDTTIRIRMIFEGLDEYREVEEQSLVPAPERSGFTVVEWGGTDLTK